MANWCSNAFYVFGDNKNDVIKFYNDMKQGYVDGKPCGKELVDIDRDWLGVLLLSAGFTKKEIDDSHLLVKGDITNLKLINEGEAVEIECESAWNPCDETIQTMLNKKYPNLEMVYQAEEPGNAIFVNSDTKHIYYKAEYIVDYYVNDDLGEYKQCNSITEVMDLITSLLHSTETEKELEKQLIMKDTDTDLSKFLKKVHKEEIHDKIFNDKLFYQNLKDSYATDEDLTPDQIEEGVKQEMDQEVESLLDDIFLYVHAFTEE